MLSLPSDALSDVRNSSFFTHDYSYGATEFFGFCAESCWDTLRWWNGQTPLSGDGVEYRVDTRAQEGHGSTESAEALYQRCFTFTFLYSRSTHMLHLLED